MATHTIVHGEGAQSLAFTPDRRVASCSYVIEDFVTYASGSSERTIASGQATLDPLSTTTDQTVGVGQTDARFIYVAATTHVTASHRYSISHVDDGSYEHFTVEGIAAGNYIIAESPLLGAYPTGSLVQGVTFRATFPESAADDIDIVLRNKPLRVAWTYDDVGGSTRRTHDLIEVVRTSTASPAVDAVVEMVEKYWDDFHTRFSDSFKLRRAVEFAIKQFEGTLLGKGIRPEDFMAGRQGELAIFWGTMRHLAAMGNMPPNWDDAQAFRELCDREYRDKLLDLTQGQPGQGVAEVEPVTDTAVANRALKYRSIISEL